MLVVQMREGGNGGTGDGEHVQYPLSAMHLANNRASGKNSLDAGFSDAVAVCEEGDGRTGWSSSSCSVVRTMMEMMFEDGGRGMGGGGWRVDEHASMLP